MTKDEVRALLRTGPEGIKSWNERKAAGDMMVQGSSLVAVNFSGFDLTGVDFAGMTLNECRFESATLVDANLKGTNLSQCNLEKAILRGANLEGGTLARANLKGADLTKATLAGAQLQSAILAGAIMSRGNLRSCKLSNVNLTSAVLKSCDLIEADLSSADLKKADCSGSVLIKTNLNNARLDGTILNYADFSDSNFQVAVLKGASFIGAKGLHGPGKARYQNANVEYVETTKFGRSFDFVPWDRVSKIGSLPLFTVSYAAIVAIIIATGFYRWFNVGVKQAREIASTQPVQDWAAHIPEIVPPPQLLLLLMALSSLAVGATIFRFACPRVIEEYSETKWFRELGQPLLEYRSANYSQVYVRFACSIFYALGFPYTLWYLCRRIWDTAFFLVVG